MLELRVDELQEIKPIGFNYEELKAELGRRLEKYRSMIYTEECISEAKNDRATLNKLDKALNERRIELEKEYMTPFEMFKDKINELRSMIKEPIKLIDDQVKAFEEKQKDAKRYEIASKYQAIFEDTNIQNIIRFPAIFNEKWLNTTYKLKDIEKELKEIYDNFNRDMTIIQNLNSEHENVLIDVYIKTRDLGQVMTEKARLEVQKEQIEKIKAEKEASSEKSTSIICPKCKNEETDKGDFCKICGTNLINNEMQPNTEEEQVEQLDFRVWVTKSQKDAIKTFLIQNKIRYGKVE